MIQHIGIFVNYNIHIQNWHNNWENNYLCNRTICCRKCIWFYWHFRINYTLHNVDNICFSFLLSAVPASPLQQVSTTPPKSVYFSMYQLSRQRMVLFSPLLRSNYLSQQKLYVKVLLTMYHQLSRQRTVLFSPLIRRNYLSQQKLYLKVALKGPSHQIRNA
jgi:hypothetical protein